MEHQPESEQRLHLNKPLFRQPGTSQPRRYEGSARASENRGDIAPGAKTPQGRSMRAERRAEERQAAAEAAKTPAERLAEYREMVSRGELQFRAPDRKRQRMVDDRPGVWQLGSWVEGDKPCPDEFLSWEGE